MSKGVLKEELLHRVALTFMTIIYYVSIRYDRVGNSFFN